MKITKLVQSKRKAQRAIVELNDGSSFVAHKDLVIKYQLWVGKELSEQDIESILSEDLYYKLFDKALVKLSYKLCSEGELRKYMHQYLVKAGIREDRKCDIEKVIADLKSRQLVDDKKLAEVLVQRYRESKSKREITLKLREKGIETDIIRDLLNSEMVSDEYDTIYKLALKKYMQLVGKSTNTFQMKQKILAFLFRKGFALDSSRKAVDSIVEGNDEN